MERTSLIPFKSRRLERCSNIDAIWALLNKVWPAVWELPILFLGLVAAVSVTPSCIVDAYIWAPSNSGFKAKALVAKATKPDPFRESTLLMALSLLVV